MKYSINHSLNTETVRKVAHKALDTYKAKFPDYCPDARWETEDRAIVSFEIAGKKLEGSVDLNPTTIDLELDLPFIFKPFQNKAISVIEKEIKQWIGKAEDGTLDDDDSTEA